MEIQNAQFLSEKLANIGRESNPKNNLSMNEALHKMNSFCRQAIKNGEMAERAKTCFKCAVEQLNKEGYSFFKPEQFNYN